MIRPLSVALGAVLVVLGVVGIAAGAPLWLCACNLVGALWAFLTVALVEPHEEGSIAVAWPAILAISFVIIGLAAMVARAPAWATVLTFAVVVAAVVLAAGAMPGGFRRYRLSKLSTDLGLRSSSASSTESAQAAARPASPRSSS
jgi:hypothetical protein